AQRISLVFSLLRGRPLWVAVTSVAEYRARLRRVVQTWRPDVIQIEFLVMGQYASSLDSCSAPRVLTQHEPGAKAARDLLDAHQGLARLIYWHNLFAWNRFEHAIITQVHPAFLFTQ